MTKKSKVDKLKEVKADIANLKDSVNTHDKKVANLENIITTLQEIIGKQKQKSSKSSSLTIEEIRNSSKDIFKMLQDNYDENSYITTKDELKKLGIEVPDFVNYFSKEEQKTLAESKTKKQFTGKLKIILKEYLTEEQVKQLKNNKKPSTGNKNSSTGNKKSSTDNKKPKEDEIKSSIEVDTDTDDSTDDSEEDKIKRLTVVETGDDDSSDESTDESTDSSDEE